MYFILIYIFIPLLYSKFYNLHIVRKLTSPQNLFIRTRVLTAGLKLHNFPVILLIWTYFFFFLYYYFIHFIIMFGSIYFSAFYVYPLLQHSSLKQTSKKAGECYGRNVLKTKTRKLVRINKIQWLKGVIRNLKYNSFVKKKKKKIDNINFKKIPFAFIYWDVTC